MSSNSFKVKNGLTISPIDLQNDPPLNPQAGDLICDSSDNNKIKRYDANAAAWVEVGSGGIGGVDIFFVQDFESASLSTFVEQTGLVLSQTDPLKGKVSAVLNHQAGVNQSFKQEIDVDRKFRGIPMVLRLDSKSDASQGNVTIKITDETNTVDLVASEQLQLSNDTAGKKTSVAFTIPATCQLISYTITALPESGKVTRIDDIICEIAETALLETAVEVPVILTQSSIINQTASFSGGATITGALTSSTNSGIYSYNSSTGVYTVLKSGEFDISISTRASASTSTICNIVINGTIVSAGSSAAIAGYHGSTSFNGILNAADTFSFSIGTNGTDQQKISVFASAVESTTKTIPLTQSGLIQEADSVLYAAGNAGQAITANVTDIPFIFQSSRGSDIQWSGSSFTVLKDGIYSIDGMVYANAQITSFNIYLYKNGTLVKTISYVDGQAILPFNTMEYLEIGNAYSLRSSDALTLVNNVSLHWLNITKQGSLKQVSVSKDQKLTIPTSELRFEGASARGTTATAIVKFDTLAKLRGDAFTVVNTADDGTYIQMNKAGKLDVSCSLADTVTTNTTLYISLNQANTTAAPTQAERLAAAQLGGATGGANVQNIAWSGFVNVGDIIRISRTINPVANAVNSLNLSFQEQDISVSVTNTLPQFSDSDSCVQLTGAGVFPYGSTATTTRRFASVVQNIGTDIEYIDSPTLGGQFIAKSSGIYYVSYSEASTANTNETMAIILVNGVPVANDRALLNTAVSTTKVANASWQGYLNAGDIVTAVVNTAASNNGNGVLFTISKVGKPNVTGVDVTPFVSTNFESGMVGEIKAFAGNVDSAAFLACDGTAVSRSGYAELFRQIGTTYGVGDGSTTFNLPDLRGVFLRGLDAGRGLDVGRTLGSYQDDAFQGHFHQWRTGALYNHHDNPDVPLLSPTFSDVRDTALDASVEGQNYINAPKSDGTNGTPRTASETRPKNVAVNYGIRFKSANEAILTPTETFSSDTASLTYASSSLYNLTTLANAPVGTYITFTYAANTNTRTQTTTRPTQTDADMNANGIQIFTRAYNAASTAGNPACIAIQIGKGMKGKSLDLYKSAGKVTAGSLDYGATSTANGYGAVYKDYNELTGILLVDSGYNVSGSNTQRDFLFSDISSQNSGYLVINASKNPALTGIGLNRIAAHYTSDAGQAIVASPSSTLLKFENKILDTTGSYNTSTGYYTIPEDGIYEVAAAFLTATLTPTLVTQGVNITINVNDVRVADSVARVGSTSAAAYPSGEVTYTAQLKKGDTISILGSTPVAASMNTSNTYNRFIVKKVSV